MKATHNINNLGITWHRAGTVQERSNNILYYDCSVLSMVRVNYQYTQARPRLTLKVTIIILITNLITWWPYQIQSKPIGCNYLPHML